MLREIAPTVIFDDVGGLLLQQRDDIPGILYPGAIGLFGGHREGEETFLACAVREIHEELSFYVPPERFDFLTRFEGADPENPEGTVRAEFLLSAGLGSLTLQSRKASCWWLRRPSSTQSEKNNAERTLGVRCLL
jgi:8-oxo-dGTP pyrophosphatase MutT (NUDIX family)